jgi:hypothetical protein
VGIAHLIVILIKTTRAIAKNIIVAKCDTYAAGFATPFLL